MERVTRIGEVFLRARDPAALRLWYAEHLGIDVQDYGDASSSAASAWATDPEENRFELWQPPAA